jgi:opacity protein-like surface antigen
MFAVPAWAQEAGQSAADRMQAMENEPTDPSYNAPYAWNISFGVGTATGANPVGSFVDEEQETIFTFDLDSGVLFNGRVARRVWWRLGVEGEFGYASTGVLVTETNLQGRNVTTEPFGDYSMGYGAANLRVDLVDARVTPFVLGGVAVVFSRYDEESSTDPGFLFGGGLDVRITDGVYLRGDVKGLRSNVDAPLLSRGILEQFEDARKALSTQLLWTLGIAVRF